MGVAERLFNRLRPQELYYDEYNILQLNANSELNIIKLVS